MVVGIDEVGRGPWAGPLVFGAVVLGGEAIEGLTDSKKLSKKKRQLLDAQIRQKAIGFGLGWVTAAEIDELGLSQACELGCRRALEQIQVPYHEIIIDGTVNFLKNTGKGPYVTTMKQADLLVPSVSAASILAKVARDQYMALQDEVFPGYGFTSHVGYGTSQHLAALQQLGVTPLHRKSFAPIATLLGTPMIGEKKSISGTTRDIGNQSEQIATDHLVGLGYDILDRNWKKKQCEIDIVATKNNIIYFVEVKHRKTENQGGGIAAITSQKLRQMSFAAKVYLRWHGQDDANARLAVVTTTGKTFAGIELHIINE